MKVDIQNEAQMGTVAAKIAPLLRTGDIVLLSGNLGAGKTVFSRALIRARAGDASLTVPSPTFTLLQTYDALGDEGSPLYHFDLYRLTDPEEIYEIGWEEALSEGITLAEWPERLGDLMPAGALRVHIELVDGQDDRRCLVFKGGREWMMRLAVLEENHG